APGADRPAGSGPVGGEGSIDGAALGRALPCAALRWSGGTASAAAAGPAAAWTEAVAMLPATLPRAVARADGPAAVGAVERPDTVAPAREGAFGRWLALRPPR